MIFLIIGCLTVALIFLLNRLLLLTLKNNSYYSFCLVALIPLVEEGIKTLLPFWAGSSIILNHAFFGAVEALDDYWNNKQSTLILMFVGFLGHLFFGYLTLLGWQVTGFIGGGLFLSFLAHCSWNYLTWQMASRRSN